MNHTATEEAHERDNVLMGMLLVNSYPAIVFFDSSASHSFVKESYILSHNMITKTLPTSYHIDALGARLQTNRVVPLAEILIEGFQFSVNLILLDTRGVDVILEMNWLTKNKAVIDCSHRTVTLNDMFGTQVHLKLKEVNPYLYAPKVVTAMDFLIIPVVCAFPDIFTEELLRMPSDRTMEFSIELLPGTTHISKRSYRMLPNELAELKKQI